MAHIPSAQWSFLTSSDNPYQGPLPYAEVEFLDMALLDANSARAAIERSVEIYNQISANHHRTPVQVQPALVAEVLRQLQSNGLDQISAPYLQLVMARLFQEEQAIRYAWSRHGNGAGSPITLIVGLEALNRMGGVQGIIQAHLDTIMEMLAPGEAEVAAHVLGHLTTPSATRISLTISDLVRVTGVPEAELVPVLEKLAHSDARILRRDASLTMSATARPKAASHRTPTLSDPPRYEVFHQILILAIHRRLARSVKSQQLWAMEQKEGHDAWHDNGVHYDAGHHDALHGPPTPLQHLLATILARFRVFYHHWSTVGWAVLLLVSVALGSLALQQRHWAAQVQEQARSEHSLALSSRSRELAASALLQLPADPELSLSLAIAAAEISPTVQAEDTLREVLLAFPIRTVLRGYTGSVNLMAFSPDGSRIVTDGMDQPAHVWETSTGKLISELQGPGANFALAAFSPDGEFVRTASYDGTARVWEAGSGKLGGILPPSSSRMWAVAVSPDGRLAVSTIETEEKPDRNDEMDGDHIPLVWETGSGKVLAHLQGLSGLIFSASFSPDGKWVAIGTSGGATQVWEAATGRPVAMLYKESTGTASVWNVAFSPDGRFIVTAYGWPENVARVWDITSGQVLAELQGHRDAVRRAAYSPDGRFIVTGSSDGTARVWQASTGRRLVELGGHGGAVTSVAFSPDGKSIATASEGGPLLGARTARIWQPFFTAKPALYPDMASILISGEYSTENADQQTTRYYAGAGNGGVVLRSALSPSGKLIATFSEDQSVRLWAVGTGRPLAMLPHRPTQALSHLAFSRDGNHLLIAAEGNPAEVYTCEVCSASAAKLLALARSLPARAMTAEEKERY